MSQNTIRPPTPHADAVDGQPDALAVARRAARLAGWLAPTPDTPWMAGARWQAQLAVRQVLCAAGREYAARSRLALPLDDAYNVDALED